MEFAFLESAKAIEAIDEAERLAGVREQVNEFVQRREHEAIFRWLRLALHYAGSTSRILWPSRKSAITRGQHLRSLLGLPDNHALSTRAIRDEIEHLDERLDVWTEQSPRPFTAVEIIVYEDTHQQTLDALKKSTALLYFQATQEVHVLGRVYSLRELKEALIDIRDRISAWHTSG